MGGYSGGLSLGGSALGAAKGNPRVHPQPYDSPVEPKRRVVWESCLGILGPWGQPRAGSTGDPCTAQNTGSSRWTRPDTPLGHPGGVRRGSEAAAADHQTRRVASNMTGGGRSRGHHGTLPSARMLKQSTDVQPLQREPFVRHRSRPCNDLQEVSPPPSCNQGKRAHSTRTCQRWRMSPATHPGVSSAGGLREATTQKPSLPAVFPFPALSSRCGC